MRRVIPELGDGRSISILCLGAHSDDIEIGCGGTILRLLEEYPGAEVCWVVFAAAGERRREAERSAKLFLAGAGRTEVIIGEFEDGFFPYTGGEIKRFFEKLKRGVTPDLIFTHYRHDLHQDHRLISELTWNTFRNHLVLEYEIAKYDGDLGTPNFFVRLAEPFCSQKVDIILKVFASQRDRAWFTDDTFYAMLRLRGIESNAPSKYAEAYHCRKLVY